MNVRVIWEFDADVSDIDPKMVDIIGLAKDLAKRELKYMIDNNLITEDDFEYVPESTIPKLDIKFDAAALAESIKKFSIGTSKKNYDPVEKAYKLLVGFRDGKTTDLDEVIGYLGEALDN